jgi:protein-tyrosine kinase
MSKIQDALKRIQDTRGTAGLPVSRASSANAGPGARTNGSSDATVTIQPRKMLDIDLAVLRKAGVLAPVADQTLISDQFREIKRPLIAHAFGRRATKVPDGHLIMISSAMPGEGKTFTAVNLALSMAQEQDHSVLLVDADVVKPHISDVFGLSDDPGLLDLLEDGSIEPNSLVCSTSIEGLSVLPAGERRANTTELLASARMDAVVSALESPGEARIVLFDSGPLLVTSESKIIASIAGQIVLVVRAEITEQGVVDNAISLLDEDKAVSLVLNQARSIRDGQVYGYTDPSSRYFEKAVSE